MQMFVKKSAWAACLVLPASVSLAAPISIQNHSFEDDPPADVTPTGWTNTGGQVPFINAASAKPFTGADGLNIGGSYAAPGALIQDTGVAFMPNTTYTMDVLTAHFGGLTNAYVEWGLWSSDALGSDLGTPGFADTQGVWPGSGNVDGDEQYDTLRSGATLSLIGTGSLGGVYTFTTGDVAPTGNVVVYLRNVDGNSMVVDNVQLDATAVPEPAGLALFGFGALLVGARRCRK